MARLKYYIFDYDNNLFHLQTKIKLYSKKDDSLYHASTEEFATLRQDQNYILLKDSFIDFKRNDTQLLSETNLAVKHGHLGPSYLDFKKCLIQGSLFQILTARGHDAEVIKNVIVNIIQNFDLAEKQIMIRNLIKWNNKFNQRKDQEDLITHYLDNCEFIAVTNDSFIARYGELDVSTAKKIAIEKFVSRIALRSSEYKISIGFSDDDLANVEMAKDLFKELKKEYSDIKFIVYDTSKNERKKIKI